MAEPTYTNPYAQFAEGAKVPQDNPYAQLSRQQPEVAPAPAAAAPEAPAGEGGDVSILMDVAQAPIGGALDSVENTGDLAISLTELGANKIGGRIPIGFALGRDYISEHIPGGDGWFEMVYSDEKHLIDDPVFGKFGQADNIGPNTQTLPGHMVRGVSNFIVSYLGAGKLLKPAGAFVAGARGTTTAVTTTAGRLAAAGGQGALAAFMGFDPQEPRLSDFIQSFPMLENPITEFLASDPADGEFEGRFKSALEEIFTGVVLEGVFMTLRGIRNARHAWLAGRTAEAEKAMVETTEKLGQLDLFTDNEIVGPAEAAISGDIRGAGVAAEKRASAEAVRLTADKEVKVDQIMENVRFSRQEGGVVFDAQRDWFNWNTWDSGDDVVKLVKKTADGLDDRLNALIKEGTYSFDEMGRDATQWLAENLNLGYDAVRIGMSRHGDLKDMVPKMLAGKAMVQSLARDIHAIAAKIDSGLGNEEDMLLLLRRSEQLDEITAYVKGIQKTAAQVTAAGRIRTHDSVTGAKLAAADIIKQLAENGGTDIIKVRARRIAAAGTNDRAVLDAARKGWVRRLIEGHNEYFLNSLLSGPKTHLVNITSNTAMTFLIPIEKMLGAVRPLHGSLDRQSFMEGYRQLVNIFTSANDSRKMFAAAMRTGRNVLDPDMAKFDAPTHAIYAEGDGLGAQMIRGVGNVVRVPTRFLMAEDEFFSQLNYRAALTAKLQVEAATKFPGDAAAQGKWVAEEFSKGFDEAGRATNKELLDYTRETIFTKDLRGTPTHSGGKSFGEWVQDGVIQMPFLRPIIPFVRTPTNIMRAVWTRTPGLNLLQKQYVQDLQAGGERGARARGKMLTGAAFYTSAYTLWANGNLTGAPPQDPNERARKLESGWKPYSFAFKQEDGSTTYVQYNRADPMGMFFGLVADLGNMGQMAGEEEYSELAAMAVTALSNNLSNKTYMKGITDALEAFDRGEGFAERYVQNFFRGYVPTGVAQVGQMFNADPNMREVRSVADAMLAKIPYFSNTLPPKRSWVTGEEIPQDTATFYPNAFLPYAVGFSKDDRVLNTLADLEHGWQAPNPVIGGVNLADEHPLVYDRYIQLVAHPPGRTGLYDALKREIERPSFDLEKEKALLADDAPGSRIDQIIRRYRDWGKRALMREKDLTWLRDAEREYKATQRDARHGEQDAIDRLIENNR